MALEKTIIPVALGQGMDRGSDPKQVQQKLLTLKNGVFTVAGAINKRTGSAVVKQAASPARFIASYKDAPILVDDALVKGRIPTVAQNTDAESWQTLDTPRLTTCTEETKFGPIGKLAGRIGTLAVKTQGIYTIIASELQAGFTANRYCTLSVYETSNWRLVDSDFLSSATDITLTVSGGAVYIYYRDNTTGRLHAGYINGSGAIQYYGEILNGVTPFAAHAGELTAITNATSGGDRTTLYYWSGAGPYALRALYLNGGTYVSDFDVWDQTSHPGGGPISTAAHGSIRAVEISAATALNAVMYVASNVGHLVGVQSVDGTSPVDDITFAAAMTDCWLKNVSGTLVALYWTGTALAEKSCPLSHPLTPAAAVNPLGEGMPLAIGTSGTDLYFLTYPAEVFTFGVMTPSVYLCKKTIGQNGCTIIGKCLNDVCDPLCYGPLPELTISSTEISGYLAKYHSKEESVATKVTFKLGTAITDVDAKEVNGQLVLPGCLPKSFDGANAIPLGLEAPVIRSVSAAAGGSKVTGVHGYQLVIKCRDKNGLLHCSAPSKLESASVTNPATGSVDVDFYAPPSTPLGSIIEVYTTTHDGSVLYLRDCIEVDSSMLDGTTRQFATFSDTASDAIVSAGAIIYTQGGLLENNPAPPFAIHCVHQNRHFVVDAVNPQTRLYYSKPFEASIAIEHSAFLTVSVPPDGGNITGLASFLDRLVVFKADRIYVLSGEGLNNVGGGAGYSEPLKITPAIGCVNHRAAVEIPDGLMFLSQNGFYLLDKSLQTRFVGKDVKSITDDATWRGLVTRGVLVPKKNCVMFVSSGSGDCTCLVYNWLFDQWGTFTNRRASDAALVNGAYWWVSDGDTHAHLDDDTVYQDAVIS